jgi:hypothetical protein
MLSVFDPRYVHLLSNQVEHGADWSVEEERTLIFGDCQWERNWSCGFSEPFHACPSSVIHAGQLLYHCSPGLPQVGTSLCLHFDSAGLTVQNFSIWLFRNWKQAGYLMQTPVALEAGNKQWLEFASVKDILLLVALENSIASYSINHMPKGDCKGLTDFCRLDYGTADNHQSVATV